jgi:arylsulfatase A-like enzyme
MRNRLTTASFAALAALLSLVVGCGEAVTESPTAPTALPAVERVILITLDTLRADHLSSFGYPLETSPWVDSVVERGVVFRRAYAHSATTKPSHASLFTSLYPLEHGVLQNGHILADDFLTMAEMMRARGFHTAGFVSTDVPLGGNVGQGFEHWDQPEWDDPDKPKSLYRPAGETIDRALAWLDSEVAADERFFLWVHVYDPHSPLRPPAADRQIIERAARALGRDEHVRRLAASDVPAARQRQYDRILRYDSEIHYADRELSRLESRLAEKGLERGALWIVTADHGQGLGAHGWFGHSVQIYNAQLHVPLVFWFADGTVTPRSIEDRVVEHVDVLPTVAELVGGDLAPQIAPIRGRSLTPFLRGEPTARPRTLAFAQRSEYADANPDRHKDGNYEPGSRYSLQSLEFKYLLFTAGEDELYDLTADPYELVNLIASPAHEGERERFARQIKDLVANSVTARAAGRVSEAESERLRALGYIQ